VFSGKRLIFSALVLLSAGCNKNDSDTLSPGIYNIVGNASGSQTVPRLLGTDRQRSRGHTIPTQEFWTIQPIGMDSEKGTFSAQRTLTAGQVAQLTSGNWYLVRQAVLRERLEVR